MRRRTPLAFGSVRALLPAMTLETRRAWFPTLIQNWRVFQVRPSRRPRRHRALEVRRFLQAERYRLVMLSATADRAMRTRAARGRAQAVYASIREWMRGLTLRDGQQPMLDALGRRAGWTRRSHREFIFEFGGRRSIIIVPLAIDVPQLIAIVTRAEVSVLLGDCDWRILKELQSLAARELQQLAAAE
jgi:hypothetical protein